MKVRIKRPFKYMDGPRKEVTLPVGVHDVTERVAGLALRYGKAELVVEKKAPENKVVAPAENKAAVGKKTVRRRSTRSKPKT
jgi:hypothetical protein